MSSDDIEIGGQIGALARAVAILTATLHHYDALNGKAVAQALRIDSTGTSSADTFACMIADLIDRTIDKSEGGGDERIRLVE